MSEAKNLADEIKDAAEELDSLKDKLNQSVRIRYEIIKRKIENWDKLPGIVKKPSEEHRKLIETWMNDFVALSKREEKIERVFRKGVDNALHSIKKIEHIKKDLPKEVKQSFTLLKKLFKKCDKLVKKYEKRIIEELRLEIRESRRKLGKAFIKKLYRLFKAELRLESEMLMEVEHDYEELHDLQDKVKHNKRFYNNISIAPLVGSGIFLSLNIKSILELLAVAAILITSWISGLKITHHANKKLLEDFLHESKDLEDIIDEGFF